MPLVDRPGGEPRPDVDFLAVDEIQLASHHERGHVFTERLLHARGKRETWFLGAETMRSAVEVLLPTAKITSSPRLSRLAGAGTSSLGQLKRRTAIVTFSLQRVYELAERVRARRGGAAIVLGALSPRARNAQVALYQSGEVDYMVATDAIGMGLNLDIDHVAFADLRKFDGREGRELEPAEMAQIAGRAGRHTRDGTFGTLAPLGPLSDRLERDLEEHRFGRVRTLVWRNPHLELASTGALLASLDAPPPHRMLRRVDRAEDHAALARIAAIPSWERRLRGEEAVRIAWEVCRIPDYRQILFEDHLHTLETVLEQLLGSRGRIDPDFLDAKIAPLEKPAPDLEGLMAQLASVRTWNYVANQAGWVDDARGFTDRASKAEDRLGDALHEALVARFVDRSRAPRISIPTAKGSGPGDARARGGPFAALAKLRAPDSRPSVERPLVEELVAASHDEIALEPTGIVRFAGQPIARLAPGRDLTTPEVVVTVELSPSDRLRAHRRLVAFTRDVVTELFVDLDAVSGTLSPTGRGLVYLLEKGLGTVLAARAKLELDGLDERDRRELARAGVVLGAWVVHVPSLLKAPLHGLRVGLVSAQLGKGSRVKWPDGSAVSIAPERGVDPALYGAIGYPVVGPRAVRADVLERVAGRIAAASDEDRDRLPISGWLGCKAHEVGAILAAARGE
jgi:ATP-dependent RNA helicase SUPV3L1/SUV3